jgi:hypothetical protein
MVKLSKPLLLTVLALTLFLLLTACGLGSAEPGRQPSPDWSRGIPLSSDVGGTLGMVVTGAADSIHIVWPTVLDDQAHIHYVQLNDEGAITVDRDLELPEGRVRSPRLLSAADGDLHLFWARRVSGSENWELWHSLLDQSGDLVGTATQISPIDTKVGTFVVAQNRDGTGYVVWEDDSSGWLVGASVEDAGIGEAFELVEEATIPGIAVDEDGILHLAWIETTAIRYASYGPDQLGSTEGVVVTTFEEQSANSIDGPAINVADGQVYIAWSTFANVGLESGSGRTEYVSFPAGAPANTASSRIWILPSEEQPYGPYEGNYPLTVLADPVTSPMLTTNIVLEPNAGAARGSELAMVVSAMQEQRLDEYVQMVLVLLEDGQFKGYQLAGKTESLSREGSLSTDDLGNLHLAWREGTGTKAYYATTAPDIQSGINSLGGGDLASMLLGGGLDAITGALFFPLSLVWFIPGFLLLGIYKLRKDDDPMSDRTSQFLAVVAIILYQLSKALFLPTIISYVPFSAWVDIPENMTKVLQVLIPTLILTLGVVIAEIVRRRNPSISGLVYFLIVCGVDAILTLGVYGVGYLGYI